MINIPFLSALLGIGLLAAADAAPAYTADYAMIDSRLYLAAPGSDYPLYHRAEFIGEPNPPAAATDIRHGASATSGSRDGASAFHLAARLEDTAANGSWATSFSGSNFFSRGYLTLAPHSTLTVRGEASGALATHGANFQGYAAINVTLRNGAWGPVLADSNKRLAFGRLPAHADSLKDDILLSYANTGDEEMNLSLSISSGAGVGTVMPAPSPGGDAGG